MSDQQNPQQSPDPNSAIPSRSRGLTDYFVFILIDHDDDGDTWQQAGLVSARRPSDALEEARKGDLVPDDAVSYVAVPVSSWHVFRPTLSFEEVK